MSEHIYRKDCGCRVAARLDGGVGVNDDCHSYTGGVAPHDGRVLANPFVYPIFWGSAYSSRDPGGMLLTQHAALTSVTVFIQTLGTWLNGLKQYGVNGLGVFSAMADTLAPGADPTALTDAQIQQELIRFIAWSQVGVPTTNELERCFLLYGRTDTCEIGDICETKGTVLSVGKWTVEKFWSQQAGACYDPSSPAPVPTPPINPEPLPIPFAPPPHVLCQTLAQRIAQLESRILKLQRQASTPTNSALLGQLEDELQFLQITYQEQCKIVPGKPRHLHE